MTPIPPSSVMFMLQAGYAAQRVMPIMLDSINGISKWVEPRLRPPDPQLRRAGQARRRGATGRYHKIRIERPKQGSNRP